MTIEEMSPSRAQSAVAPPTYRTKLIEVALPLEAINVASAREKSIRHGHPSTLHLWWARRPLATCRAVLFAQLVDDPSAVPEEFPTEEAQEAERQRLFGIIETLVKWESTTNEAVLMPARREIARSAARSAGVPGPDTDDDVWRILREHAPPVLDPFCGGGSIPLEAQRLGLEAHASDLNPVAVLITKAMIEIPPKFAGLPPVNPRDRDRGMGAGWKRAAGLAADVRYYGEWMREEAYTRIGHLYPKVRLPEGGEATVIAWLWARTVICPNPACGARMPLVRSFALSTKKGKETWVEPVVDREAKTVQFEVGSGAGKPPEGTVDRRGARCIVCRTDTPFDHVRNEGKAGRIGQQLMAIVVEGQGRRLYLPPSNEQATIAARAEPEWAPETDFPEHALGFRVQLYGMTKHRDLFTPRQLVALTTFSDLVTEARERVLADSVAAGLANDGVRLDGGGRGATAYADAMATYLAFALDKVVDRASTICSWDSSPKMEALRNTFARQAIPMTWDFAEGNPFSESSGNWLFGIEWVADATSTLPSAGSGRVMQADATQRPAVGNAVFSTDPPYYDNIGYADLSDFFYVWLRRSLCPIYPELFRTMLVPKAQELIATPYRFDGSKDRARVFFEEGLGRAFLRMRNQVESHVPLTIYYAFKQAESKEGDTVSASTGWETMLFGLLNAGFAIVGTWPMRSELSNRMIASGTNALASSIVLVCRPRPADAPLTTRSDFLRSLKRELPDAIKHLQSGNIAAVDLAQASIGPGMAVFSRYAKVLETSGTPMSVRTALGLINASLDEVVGEQEGEYDAHTRWAIAWFDSHGMEEGPYGVAETLSTAKNCSVTGLREAGIVQSRAGKVRLVRRDELTAGWDPATSASVSVWSVAQQLIRSLDTEDEQTAAELLRRVGGLGEAARDLAYLLFLKADRKKWSGEALAFNSLVVAWPELRRLAGGEDSTAQGRLI